MYEDDEDDEPEREKMADVQIEELDDDGDGLQMDGTIDVAGLLAIICGFLTAVSLSATIWVYLGLGPALITLTSCLGIMCIIFCRLIGVWEKFRG